MRDISPNAARRRAGEVLYQPDINPTGALDSRAASNA